MAVNETFQELLDRRIASLRTLVPSLSAAEARAVELGDALVTIGTRALVEGSLTDPEVFAALGVARELIQRTPEANSAWEKMIQSGKDYEKGRKARHGG